MSAGDLIAGNINDTKKTKTMFASKSDVNDELVIASTNVKIIDLPEVRETQTINGTNCFILGNPSYGLLGTGQLGDSDLSSYLATNIVNPNNTWQWLMSSLENTYWVNTGVTTGTVTADTSIVFTTGQIFQTNKLSTTSSNILKATLSINPSNITSIANLTFYLSANNGSNFEVITNGVEYTFANVGTNLMLKVVASGNATISLKDSKNVRTPIQISYILQ